MGVSTWQLLIVFLIIILVFGTKRLKGMGGDIGTAIRDFKLEMKDVDSDKY
ncbi:twin-arginine translocase TatA/TatE family subunit [Thaumasiovibrio sp. DFM-14]|uniref:twin-arginine translocase TatA/TatE family subunit n=1 Tax=Thaumasiovibrio sp. DFM-14 TaxID=3384792 RepID=UPI0039A17F35